MPRTRRSTRSRRRWVRRRQPEGAPPMSARSRRSGPDLSPKTQGLSLRRRAPARRARLCGVGGADDAPRRSRIAVAPRLSARLPVCGQLGCSPAAQPLPGGQPDALTRLPGSRTPSAGSNENGCIEVFTVLDGKIQAFRECMDTLYASHAFSGAGSASGAVAGGL